MKKAIKKILSQTAEKMKIAKILLQPGHQFGPEYSTLRVALYLRAQKKSENKNFIKRSIRSLAVNTKGWGLPVAELETKHSRTEAPELRKSYVIFGPPASGKTTHAEAMRKYFRLRFIQDDWEGPIRDAPAYNHLIITNENLTTMMPHNRRVIPIKEALKQAGIK